MTQGPGEVSGGRLSLDAYVDTAGLSRGLQRRVDAATADIRVRLRAEVQTRGVKAQAKRAAEEAAAGARLRLKVQIDERGLRRDVKAAAQRLSDEVKVRLRVEVDERSVAETRAKVEAAAAGAKASIDVDADTAGAKAKIEAERRSQQSRPIKLPVTADTKPFEQVARKAGRALTAISKIPLIVGGIYTLGTALVSVGGGLVAITGAAGQAVTALAALPNLIGIIGQSLSALLIGFSGVGGAIAALSKADQEAAQVTEQTTKARQDAARQVGDAERGLADARRAGAQAARDSARAIADAEASVADARRSQTRNAADAARSIADAERGLAQARASARSSAADAVRSIADAERGLADARRTGAAAARAAADAVRDAEANLARSQDASRDAQEGLTQARRDAREEIEDLNRALAASRTDEESAANALLDAQERLADVSFDASATDKERRDAATAVKEARDNVAEARDRRQDLRKETARANKEGVEGSQIVEDARDAAADAARAEADALRSLSDSRRAAADTARANARAVADAQRAIRDAERDAAESSVASAQATEAAQRSLADARRDAAQTAADDARTVTEAEQGVQRAREAAAESQRSSARSIADAQRTLADAQRNSTAAATAQTAAQTELAAAMDNLSPAARRFARFLFGLRDRWYELRNAVAQALLPPIQRGITKALPLLDVLQVGLVDTARRIGSFVESLGGLFGSRGFGQDVTAIMASNNRALTSLLNAGLNLIEMFADLAVVAGPTLVEPFGKWVEKLTQSWKEAIRADRESGTLATTLEKAADRAAQLGDIFGNLATAIFNMGSVAAGPGQTLLDMFEGLTERMVEFTESDEGQQKMLDFFEATVPVTAAFGDLIAAVATFLALASQGNSAPLTLFFDILTSIVEALNDFMRLPGGGEIVGALLVLSTLGGALGLVSGIVLTMVGNIARLVGLSGGVEGFLGKIDKVKYVFGLLLGPVGLTIAAIAGVIAILVLAYQRVEWFRDAVNTAGRWIVKAVGWIGDGFVWLWKKAIKPALGWIGDRVVDLWRNEIKPTFDQWVDNMRVVGGWLSWLWKKVVRPVLGWIGDGFGWLWKNHIKPALNQTWGALQTTGRFFSWLWKKVISPVLGWIGDAVGWLWSRTVRPNFREINTAVSWLGDAFTWLWKNAIKPAFEAIAETVVWTWRRILKPTFEFLRDMVRDTIPDAFSDAVDGIRRMWDRLKAITSRPVKFVVDTVYTNGIRKVVNAIPGVPDLPSVTFPGFASGGVLGRFARGGMLPGYSPGKDIHRFWSPTGGGLDLAGGEPIMRPEFGRAVGDTWVNGMNRLARTGGVDAVRKAMAAGTYHAESFARGGFFRPAKGGSTSGNVHGSPPAIDLAVPVGTTTVAVAPGRVASSQDITGYEPRAPHGGLGYRSYGRVIEIMHAGFRTLYAHLSRRDVAAGAAVRAGQRIGLSGNTGYSYGPHIHFGSSGPNPNSFLNGTASTAGPGSGDSAEPGGGGGFSIKNPLSFLHLDDWKDRLSGMGEWGSLMGSMAGNLVPQVTSYARKGITAAYGKVKGWLGDVLRIGGNGGAPGAPSGASGGSANPSGLVPIMAQAMNYAKERWSPRLGTIYGYSDRNIGGTATKSDHAYGKALDFMTHTNTTLGNEIANYFAGPTGRGRFNIENIIWNRRITNAGRGWQWGAYTGSSPHTDHVHVDTYDTGGSLYPGSTLAVNKTGKTETVFTNDNMVALSGNLVRVSAALMSALGDRAAQAGMGALVENLTITGTPEALPEMLADANHELRVIRYGGVYASRP